jgi:hypothetical protein
MPYKLMSLIHYLHCCIKEVYLFEKHISRFSVFSMKLLTFIYFFLHTLFSMEIC